VTALVETKLPLKNQITQVRCSLADRVVWPTRVRRPGRLRLIVYVFVLRMDHLVVITWSLYILGIDGIHLCDTYRDVYSPRNDHTHRLDHKGNVKPFQEDNDHY